MNEPAVIIRLDSTCAGYQPGETLSGEYRLQSVDRDELSAIEVSVLWYTEGKGDEDLAVHEFWRRDVAGGDPIDPRRPERFSTTLPPSPLSYDGQIVKIRWCVRVRAFLTRGKELVGQKVFRLGNVPPVRAERTSKAAARAARGRSLPPGEGRAEGEPSEAEGRGEGETRADEPSPSKAARSAAPGKTADSGPGEKTSPTRIAP
jgi:hypothetical protein